MRVRPDGHMLVFMTLNEHIDRQSFAYCDELPPDVAEGLPLTAARRAQPRREPALRRALQTCVRAVSRRR